MRIHDSVYYGNGLMSIVTLGGFHLTSLPAHSVIVRTAEGKMHRGITTSSKPVLFSDTGAEGGDNSLRIEDILIDVAQQPRVRGVVVYGIRPATPVVPDVAYEYHEENGICFKKAFDNPPAECFWYHRTYGRLWYGGRPNLAARSGGALRP